MLCRPSSFYTQFLRLLSPNFYSTIIIYNITFSGNPPSINNNQISEFQLHNIFILFSMFNHQNQGGMNPQMLQMQRFMANRPQRTSAFMAQNGDMQMNTPAELNDRRFPMGWAQQQQRNFPLAPPHNLMGFPAAAGRPEFNNFGMLANPMAGSSSAGMGQMGESSNFIGNSSVRLPFFKCPECNIVKNSGEDLEVHTKTEHLNWLPFICPLCHAGRASDIQMREHMYSFHKKNENKYIYHDNPQAKKILQEMMDKALFGASNQFQQMKRRSTFSDTKNAAQPMDSTKRARLDEVEEELKGAANKKPGEETSKKQQNTSETGNLSEGNAGSIGGGQERQQSIDEETDAQLNAIFGRRNIKSEFDDLSALDGTPSPHLSMNDELGDDNSHTLDALQNVAAMFSASGGSIRQQGTGRNRNSSGLFRQQKRIVRNRPGPMTSKKRVLGECGRCHKPITAGARQMHMFFHLGKDKKTFRFRCKHPGCPVEHYRKDQMENHQSKVHGQVDPNMMDDRTQELYNMVQKLSMELLGTVGNTPGPTAAKAQLLYDQQMREMHDNVGPRKRNSNGNGGIRMFDSANRKIEDLECKICNKTIMSRIRGFHILWHLNNDLGIVRYGCKFCNFKHDRPQSVVAHGSRDHGVQNCCDDLLYNFEDELKSMSKACFGVERLFEKEIRRRIKMEQGGDSEQSPKQEEDEEEDSQTGSCSYARTHRSAAQIAILKVPLKAENSDRSWATTSTPKDQVKKRRSIRRFGTRRTKSRRQKAEMIKLREVSMRLGGAQYFKKKTNEAVPCEKCGKLITNRLSDHAYTHLDGCDLFRCQQCNLGHYSRETIVRHLRDFHNTNNEPPLDNRLRYAQEIKDAIRDCYPTLFVDAPIPMKEDIEKLKSNLKLENMVVDDDDEEKEEAKEEDEEGEEGNEEEEEEEANGEMETTGNDESGLNEEEEEMIFMEEELERGEEEEGHEDYDEEEEEGMEGEEGGEDDDEEEEEKEQKGKGGNKVEENE